MSGASARPTPEEMQRLMDCVARWRHDPDDPVYCPRCGLEGLCVIDRSSRPHAEWYVVTCAACTFEATLQIPLAPPH